MEGPRRLREYGGEAELKEKVESPAPLKSATQIGRERAALGNAAGLANTAEIADPAERARALERSSPASRGSARERRSSCSAVCGKAAAPTLERLLARRTQLLPLDLVDAFVAVAPDEAGPALTRRLEGELPFWRERAPTLDGDWISDRDLSEHYSYVFDLLRGLDRLRCDDCSRVVWETRDLWTSPPLDREGRGHVDVSGDRVLREILARKTAAK